ncbi:hypothetical protein ACO0LL_13605 [Undibacterium sp. TC4M20W]|uniref:hypothetical protein n=1 Tax=Undibacterium sp. TC4M20W TaxID=3413052 RepID=UPI003BEF897C
MKFLKLLCIACVITIAGCEKEDTYVLNTTDSNTIGKIEIHGSTGTLRFAKTNNKQNETIYNLTDIKMPDFPQRKGFAVTKIRVKELNIYLSFSLISGTFTCERCEDHKIPQNWVFVNPESEK